MTQKEKLFGEWFAIKQQTAELKGETFNTKYDPSINTVAEWKSWIESAKRDRRELERAMAARRVADYYLTEDGMLYKQEREARKEALYKEEEALYKKCEADVRKMVQELIGVEFDINFGHSQIQIGLVERYRDNSPIFKFGHVWTIYYGKSLFIGNDFKMNFPTMGSFNLIADLDMTTYLAGMAKFASSTDFLYELKSILDTFTSEFKALDRQVDEIEKELRNPKMA